MNFNKFEIEAIIFYSFVIPCGTESTFFLHVHEMLYLNLIKSLSMHICGNLYVMKLFFKLKGGAGPDLVSCGLILGTPYIFANKEKVST